VDKGFGFGNTSADWVISLLGSGLVVLVVQYIHAVCSALDPAGCHLVKLLDMKGSMSASALHAGGVVCTSTVCALQSSGTPPRHLEGVRFVCFRLPGAGSRGRRWGIVLSTPPVVCVLFCPAPFVTIPSSVAEDRHVPSADDAHCRITHAAPSSVSETAEDWVCERERADTIPLPRHRCTNCRAIKVLWTRVSHSCGD
jgi:hypothetical protein